VRDGEVGDAAVEQRDKDRGDAGPKHNTSKLFAMGALYPSESEGLPTRPRPAGADRLNRPDATLRMFRCLYCVMAMSFWG
jgi:hypothetical protein